MIYFLFTFYLLFYVLQGDILVVELLFGNRVDPLPLPFGAVSARDYLTFLHWKKLFEIIPLSTTDAQIVLKHKTLMYNKNNKDKDKDKDKDQKVNHKNK